MEFLQPPTWREALEARAAHPDALPIWGGTDVMVELNFARKRPEALLDLTRVDELSRWSAEDGWFRIGAGVSYTRVIDELGAELPGLAMASRTVGSPQIRNRGTIGGNLGSASPAGDALPPLFAGGAEIELASARGSRRVAVDDFVVGPKRNALGPDELIAAVWMPRARGAAAVREGRDAQRDGDRRVLVRARPRHGTHLHRLGGAAAAAGPRGGGVPGRAGRAGRRAAARFGELVASAASPIDDVRGTAAYRRHALGVLARRTLTWAWKDRAG